MLVLAPSRAVDGPGAGAVRRAGGSAPAAQAGADSDERIRRADFRHQDRVRGGRGQRHQVGLAVLGLRRVDPHHDLALPEATPHRPDSAREATRIPVTILGGAPFAQTLETLLRSAGADVALRPLVPGLRGPWSDGAYIVSPDLSDAALGTAREVLADLLAAERPVLALGHGMVALAELFGAKVEPANTPRHGERVLARPSAGSSWLLPNRAEPVLVGCYHRRVVLSSQMPDSLSAIAQSDAGEVLALEHGTLPVGGLLFRPESLLTSDPDGPIHAFLQRAASALLKAR